jgi:N-acetylneuraminate 9-O-acetyltransferase
MAWRVTPLAPGLRDPECCRVLALDRDAVLANKETLGAAAEFCAWMLWIFLADRTSVLGTSTKDYNRDVFLAVLATVILVSFGTGVKSEKRVMTLSRHQTEEWKGWMQVCPHPCYSG